jgi:hypothetical protein
VLRSVLHHVELDEQMRPVRAEWLVPEWRSRVRSGTLPPTARAPRGIRPNRARPNRLLGRSSR